MKKTYKYQLPQNKEVKSTAVRVENGEILVDVEFEERFEPKDGDFCISDSGFIFIFKDRMIGEAKSYCGVGCFSAIKCNSIYSIKTAAMPQSKKKPTSLKDLKKNFTSVGTQKPNSLRI